MEAILEATVARDLRQERSAADAARRARCRPWSTAPRARATAERTATPIAVDPKALLKILHSESGANTLISLKLDGGGDAKVLVKEYQLDPVTHAGPARRLLPGRDGPVLQVTIPVVGEGRAEGRQAAGRHPRVRPPRDRGRVPAGATFRSTSKIDVTRADAAPGHPRARHRDQPEVDADQRSATLMLVHVIHAEGRGSGGARPKRAAAPTGDGRARGHQEGQEGRGRRRRRTKK